MKLLFPMMILASVTLSSPAAEVTVDFAARSGPMRIERMALGQGGLSDEPMFDSRIAEIRALHPAVIRLFLQQYFDPLPRAGVYNFRTMDRSVDTIRATGATPLMTIAFKPKALYPKIDHKITDPTSYPEWDRLITEMVRHYKQRGSSIRYWEVSNEPDIGESGGSPYLFTPEGYVRYYGHTADAILRADPDAKVGGPALAGVHSALLPALLDAASNKSVPLHFISWHIYNSDPKAARATIDYARHLLEQHPNLHLETFLNEWNMSLSNPVQDPRFQPCFIAETIYQMKEGGLDYSCYYHIRDYHVDPEVFGRFMSASGTAMMTRWWNRMGQFDGLFDYQNSIRPSYFLFKLLSRLTGDRVRLDAGDGRVHGFASRDTALGTDNVMLWNFASEPVSVDLRLQSILPHSTLNRIVLQPEAPSSDENIRLKPVAKQAVTEASLELKIELEPYGVTFLWLEKR